MAKFAVWSFFLVVLVLVACCLSYGNAGAPNGNAQFNSNANGIIQKIISEYEARHPGPSVVYPEEPAHIVDPDHLHASIL